MPGRFAMAGDCLDPIAGKDLEDTFGGEGNDAGVVMLKEVFKLYQEDEGLIFENCCASCTGTIGWNENLPIVVLAAGKRLKHNEIGRTVEFLQ